MQETMMGLETEYGLRCDLARLHSILGGNIQGHIIFILKQVPSVLPGENYIEVHKSSGEFWTRGSMRCYPDRYSSVEIATGECATFQDLVFQKNVGDRLVQALVDAAKRALLADPYNYSGPLEAFANNTASGLGGNAEYDADNESTFGCHENYLLRRDLFHGGSAGQMARYNSIFENAGVFLVARPLIGGSGHISRTGMFLLSPRMNWVSSAVSSATTSGRPLVNSRDETHADPSKFFRYHHIMGDTNITDEVCRMKIAFSYWVLRLVERGWRAPVWLRMRSSDLLPLSRAINNDPRLENRHQLGRRKFSAAEILEIYLNAVDNNRERILFEEEDDKIFNDVVRYLELAKTGFEALAGQSEWATKYLLVSREAERRGFPSLNHPLILATSLALHNLNQNPKENPFILIRNRVLPPNIDVGALKTATAKAPRTRAFVRGLAVFLASKFRVPIIFPTGSEWSSISFPWMTGSQWAPYYFLNKTTPWEILPSDIKRLIVCFRPALSG